eukprot:Selendium_serpulae@DN4310_c0_g1_i2.p1
MPVRFILVGDLCGRLVRLAEVLAVANEKQGPFAFAIAVGRFKPQSQEQEAQFNAVRDGEVPLPFPVYVVGSDIGANDSCVDDFKNVQNFRFLLGLGRQVIEGLSVAYLTGEYSSSENVASLFKGHCQSKEPLSHAKKKKKKKKKKSTLR